jgi:hypothetical protein
MAVSTDFQRRLGSLPAALLSVLVPGSGQLIARQPMRAAIIFLSTLLLLVVSWWIGRWAGRGADILFLMVVVLPWWAVQSYDAFLTTTDPDSGSFRTTVSTLLDRGHDIRFLGALFLLTAITDLYIIVVNPAYSLTVFCVKPAGLLGVLAKAQSPTLHVLIGYGFLRVRTWALVLYLAYAAFGLLNATTNYACFGYGRVRTVFLITLIAFTLYILWRRRRFSPAPATTS